MKCILRNADYVFWEGLGDFRKMAIKYGAKNIYLAPSNFDTDRFKNDWEPTVHREHDLSMIASSGRTRLPFRYLPGGKNRIKCVKSLTKTFGKRFALYGYGWGNLESYRGPIPFSDQHKMIRSSWISVNWDHFDDVSFYNSNRLPISMAAGVPHITTYHKGFEYLYEGVKGGLYFAHKPEEVVDLASYLLSKTTDELIEEGLSAQEYAYKYLNSKRIYRNIILKLIEKCDFGN